MTKTAVVLLNLGGPDDLKAVKPFLFNLFNDKNILRIPQPLRFFLAKFIAAKRTGKAKAIYQQIGGKSPILEHTQAQANALEQRLGKDHKVFVCMRHWHPMSSVVIKNVKAYQPDRVILMPLYPQFSTTTTGSSFAHWQKMAQREGFNAPTAKICCYPGDRGFVASHVKLIKDTYWKAAEESKPRILFSAHGLPEKIIAAGDPYRYQVEKTVSSIVQVLAMDDIDYSICYQSRVGMLKWLTPSIDEEIERAGKDGVPIIIVPVAFVSEHSETLVELDITYRLKAEKCGVPSFWRVPALGVEPLYIETLADLCEKAVMNGTCSYNKTRQCPPECSKCPCAA